jgi:hypothetical protein
MKTDQQNSKLDIGVVITKLTNNLIEIPNFIITRLKSLSVIWRLVLLGIGIMALLVLLLFLLGDLGRSLKNYEANKKQIKQNNLEQSINHDKADFRPEQYEGLTIPHVPDMLTNGYFDPVFPLQSRWSEEDFTKYSPDFDTLLLDALSRKNRLEFKKILDSLP